MGARLSYYLNNREPLNEVFLLKYPEFKKWYLELDEEEQEMQISTYLAMNDSLLKADKALYDLLANEFFLLYCELVEKELFEFYDPCMNKWRYQLSTELVNETGNVEFIMLWSYLVIGRSLYDSTISSNNFGSIGYLSKLEYNKLKYYIYQYFGGKEQMVERYWTDDEKCRWSKMIELGVNGISNHSPKSEGLELVLQVLEEVSCLELITYIE